MSSSQLTNNFSEGWLNHQPMNHDEDVELKRDTMKHDEVMWSWSVTLRKMSQRTSYACAYACGLALGNIYLVPHLTK